MQDWDSNSAHRLSANLVSYDVSKNTPEIFPDGSHEPTFRKSGIGLENLLPTTAQLLPRRKPNVGIFNTRYTSDFESPAFGVIALAIHWGFVSSC